MEVAECCRKGRKHCRKRRNCSLRAISPFPTVFSKHLYCRHEKKKRTCLGKAFSNMVLTFDIKQKETFFLEAAFRRCVEKRKEYQL